MASEGGERVKSSEVKVKTNNSLNGDKGQMTRRGFLASMATVGVAIAAHWGQSKINRVGNIVNANKSEDPTPRPIIEVKETIDKYPNEFKAIFHHLNNDELTEVEKRILHSKMILEEKTPLRDHMDELYKYNELINNSEKNNDIPKNLLFGLIIAESQGRANVESPVGAVGLMQLMKEKAIEIGLRVDDEVDERLDPEKAVTNSAEALAQNFERYGDWGLALWEWHMGAGNEWDLLNAYFKEKGIRFPEEDYRGFIEGDGLNVHRLLYSDAGQEYFSTGKWDYTEDYIYNIVAGVGIYRQYIKNKLIILHTTTG